MEHTNLEADDKKTIGPQFTKDNLPDFDKVLQEEGIHWFTQWADAIVPATGTPKYGVQDTLNMALDIGARMAAYPIAAQVNANGDPVNPIVRALSIELAVEGFRRRLEYISNHVEEHMKSREGTDAQGT